ncbi:hypothetical protein B5S31_g3828 [[Candida] boidinii]|nr:hypothetical protein B5S31_g3828 [[Candida] boidinii]
MNKIFKLLLLVPLLQLCAVALQVSSFYGCAVPTESLENGFDVRIFSYPLSGQQFKTRNFYYSRYTSTGMIGSTQVYGTTPYMTLTWTTQRTVREWGLYFINYPFLAEFTMYFSTDITGYHQFIFNSIDDGAMVFMGNGAFGCCDNTDISGVKSNAEILWAYKYDDNTPPDTQSTNVYLQAGIYYPLRIVYINILTLAALDFQIKNPLGETIDLENHLYILPDTVDENLCSTTTGALETTVITCQNDCTKAVTITTETVITTENTHYTLPHVVVTTPALSTITTTVACPKCSQTVTVTTETVISSGRTSISVIEIIVNTPVRTITTTVPCLTCSTPITITTEVVLTTGTVPETVEEVIVSTPVRTITTTVPCLTCSTPITITTEVVLTTGTAPVTVPEVIVGTPVSTLTTTVACPTCTAPVTITTETVITTGTAPVTVPEVIVSTPVSTLTTTVACPTCTAPVTITTETIITTGTAPVTVLEVIVSSPVETLSTTVPCVSCTAPVTITTETIITTGTAPVTVPEVIVGTPVSTLTTTVACPDCLVPITGTLTSVMSSGTVINTEVVIVISAPLITSIALSSSVYSIMTGGFHFSNSSAVSTIHQSSSKYIYSVSSYKYSFGSSTKVAGSDTLKSPSQYVTLTSTLTDTTLSSVFYSTTATTVDVISATESLSHTTESLLTRAVTTTDVKTIKVTVSCSPNTGSTPESLVGNQSKISYIYDPITSGPVSENFTSSKGASFTAEGPTTLQTETEYFTLNSILSVKSSISLSTPYQGQTQATSTSFPTKSDVLLSSSSVYSEIAEAPSEYTGGSTDGKSNSIFTYLLVFICVILFI